MDEGHPVGITVDGPRGPAMVAQPGAVWMAKVTGNPILPFHVESSSYWTAPSWDASQIPVSVQPHRDGDGRALLRAGRRR